MCNVIRSIIKDNLSIEIYSSHGGCMLQLASSSSSPDFCVDVERGLPNGDPRADILLRSSEFYSNDHISYSSVLIASGSVYSSSLTWVFPLSYRRQTYSSFLLCEMWGQANPLEFQRFVGFSTRDELKSRNPNTSVIFAFTAINNLYTNFLRVLLP